MTGISREARAEREARVKCLTEQGWPATEIAAVLKISTRTVVRYRRVTGCSQPVGRHLTDDEIATAGEMLDDGCSYTEVARTLGVSAWAIATKYPGRSWTPSQVSAHGCLHRKFRCLPRSL